MTKLDTVLKKTTTTTLQHYFSWLTITTFARSLGEPYRQPLSVLYATLNGMPPNFKVDRWKTCVESVSTNVGEIVGHYFVKERFKGNSRKDFTAIIESLRDTYAKALPAYKWFDKTTLEGALKKLAAIEPLVGYSTGSPDVPSTKSLKEYYEGYNVTTHDFFANQLTFATWSNAKTMSLAGKPIDRMKMLTTPQTVNAFYSPYSNQVLFPAGLLQFPYYHVENPEYVNYGAMGVIAGHEITVSRLSCLLFVVLCKLYFLGTHTWLAPYPHFSSLNSTDSMAWGLTLILRALSVTYVYQFPPRCVSRVTFCTFFFYLPSLFLCDNGHS
jgi:endothelin-converting enzyme